MVVTVVLQVSAPHSGKVRHNSIKVMTTTISCGKFLSYLMSSYLMIPIHLSADGDGIHSVGPVDLKIFDLFFFNTEAKFAATMMLFSNICFYEWRKRARLSAKSKSSSCTCPEWALQSNTAPNLSNR